MAKISIIIPVYNVEKYLRQCLDSLVNQTLKDIEIIIVDDGSQDSSGEFCDEYALKDDRIKVIHKENGGLGNARNVGMTYATGDYLAFVDSDDWVTLDYFEKLYDSAIKNNTDVSIGTVIVFKNGKSKKKINPQKIEMLFAKQGFACLKIYKRDFIEQFNLQFTEKLYYEDMFFAMMVYLNMQNYSIVNDAYYYYRHQEGSITHTCIQGSKLFDVFKVYDSIKKELKKNKNERYQIYNKVTDASFIAMFAGFIYRLNNENRLPFIKEAKEKIKNINLSDNTYASWGTFVYRYLINNVYNYEIFRLIFVVVWLSENVLLKERK